MQNVLPIGTVVLLKDAKKTLMIIGFCQIDLEKGGTIYDYSGIMYPEGYLGPQSVYMFNKDVIDKVLYGGFNNEESKEFLNKITEAQAKLKEGLSIEEVNKIFAGNNYEEVEEL